MMAESSVLLLCDDLMFGSRIGATARAHGGACRSIKSVDAALTALSEQTPSSMLVDLSIVGDRLGELMTAVSNLTPPPIVVAFGSHVDAARLQAAADAGCDVVLPRSKFVEALEVQMPRWLAPRQDRRD